MSGTSSRSTYGMVRFVGLIKRYRSHFPIVSSQGHTSRPTTPKSELDSIMHRRLMLVTRNSETSSSLTQKVVANLSKNNKIGATAAPAIPRFNISTWARWLVGFILSLLIPFWKQKWDKLKRVEGEVESLVEQAESVAEMVDKVATIIENTSVEIAEKHPENGKIKETALFVESVSNTISHDAQEIKDLCQKVETLKHDFDKIEALIEPTMEKIIQHKIEQRK